MTDAYNPGSRFTPRSSYAPRIDPMDGKKPEFHAGQDFAAPAGTPIPAAAIGKVVYSGFNKNLGNVVIVRNDTGNYSLYGHMLDGSRVEVGQTVWPGDTVGLVGSTGARTTGPHLHYSVINKDAGDGDEAFPSKGGAIGVSLNETTTVDPATYGNYRTLLPYLDGTKHAAEIMSGTGASATSRGPLPDRLESFDERVGKWGSSPASVAPISASDSPAPFDSRFGNWGSAPTAGFGQARSPVLRELEKRRSSAAPVAPPQVQDASSPPSAVQPDAVYSPAGNFIGNFPRISAAATPSPVATIVAGPIAPDSPNVESAFGGRSENASGGPRPDTNFRRLSRRDSSALSSITSKSPMPAPEPGSPLGIVSGRPMSQWPLPPQVFGLTDNSNGAGQGNWFDFLATMGSPSLTPPAQPLVPSDSANAVGGLAGRIAALVGIDRQDPTMLAPPLDDGLRGFYRDDPLQPWLVQGWR